MTRKDWEKIERVLKDAKLVNEINYDNTIPTTPSAAWMRRRIAQHIAEAFELGPETRAIFMKACSLPKEI